VIEQLVEEARKLVDEVRTGWWFVVWRVRWDARERAGGAVDRRESERERESAVAGALGFGLGEQLELGGTVRVRLSHKQCRWVEDSSRDAQTRVDDVDCRFRGVFRSVLMTEV